MAGHVKACPNPHWQIMTRPCPNPHLNWHSHVTAMSQSSVMSRHDTAMTQSSVMSRLDTAMSQSSLKLTQSCHDHVPILSHVTSCPNHRCCHRSCPVTPWQSVSTLWFTSTSSTPSRRSVVSTISGEIRRERWSSSLCNIIVLPIFRDRFLSTCFSHQAIWTST